jgi:hypothetical protein
LQRKRETLRTYLLGTVAVFSAGPAFAQADAPRLGAPSRPAPTTERTVVQQNNRPAIGPGALDGQLAQPGGTTRDSDTLDLPDPQSVLDGLPADRPAGVDRGVAVTARRRPAYDPIGARLGAYTLQASAATTLGYDSNVFSQDDGVSDAYASLRAAALLRSAYSRHLVELEAYAEQRLFASFGTENALTYAATARGRYDIGALDSLTVNVTREHQIIERGAVGEVLLTRRPVRYDLTGAGLSGRKVFGRVTVDLSGQVSDFDYDDARRPAGATVDQDFRDFLLYEARADLGYASGGAITLFGSVTGEARRFRINAPPIDRDSDLIEVLGGVRGEITPLLRGQFGVGYIFVDFMDPNFKSRGGLGINVSLQYLVTELTTVQFSGRRRLQNVGSAIAPASLTTELRVGVDHELLRNLIVSAGVGYQNADFVDNGQLANRQPATRLSLDLGARYLINRRFRLGADIDYRRRDGGGGFVDGLSSNFERVRASVSIIAAL